MKLSYEIQPQNLDGLMGEIILAKADDKPAGRIGYVQHNYDEYKFNGLKNARLKLLDSFCDVEVDGPMRQEGVDLFLFEILFEQLWIKNFGALIITQPDIDRKFYDKVLGMLRDCGKLTSWYRSYNGDLGNVYVAKI